MAGQKVDELFYDMSVRTGGLATGLGAAQRAMKGFVGFVKGPGGPIAAVAALGAAFVAAQVKGTAMAAELDKELRQVATLLPQTVGQLGALRDGLVNLSTRVPQRPELLTRAAYQAVSAGARDTAEALEVVEVASKAAVAGLTDSFTAVDAISTVLNAYGKSASEASAVSDVLFATVERGKTTFPELASSIGGVVTTAAQAGISIEEVGAAFATLTKRGLDSKVVATSLNRLFLSFIKTTDEAAAVHEELGLELNKTAVEQKGLAGIMREINEATDGQIDKLAEVNPNIRALRASLVLASNEGLQVFEDDLNRTENALGTANEAFREVTGAADEQWQLFKNKLSAQLISLGQHTLPLVIGVLRQMNELLESDTERMIRLLDELGESELAAALKAQEAMKNLREEQERLAESTKELETRAAVTRGEGPTGTRLGATTARRMAEIRGSALQELNELELEGLSITEQRHAIEKRMRELQPLLTRGTRDQRLVAAELLGIRREQLRNLQQQEKQAESLTRLAGEQREELEELLAERRDPVIEAISPIPGLPGEGGEEEQPEVGVEVDEEELDKARTAIRDLLIEMEVLDEFEFEDALGFEDLPDEIAEALGEIRDLRKEREALETVMAAEGRTPELVAALERVNAQLEQQRETVEELRGDTEVWLTEAQEQADDLTESFRLLEELGLAGVSTLPEGAQEQIKELGELERKIEELEDVIEELPEGERRAAAERLLEQWKGQRAEVRTLVLTVGGLREMLERFDQVDLDMIEELSPEQVSALRQAMRELAPAVDRVRQAQAELEIAEMGDDADRVKDATDELADAEDALAAQMAVVEKVLRAAGIEGEQLAEIMAALRGETEGAEEPASDLVDTLSTIEGVARGVLSVADAMGVLSDEAEQALTAVVDLAEAGGRIAAGDYIGGITQAIGGIVSLGGALFGGESEEERKTRQAMQELRASIERLRSSFDKQREALAGLPGELVTSVQVALSEAMAGGVREGGGFELGDVTLRLVEAMEAQGVTAAEMLRAAEAFGLSTDAMEKFFARGGDFEAFQTLTMEERGELMQTLDALAEFMEADFGELLETFSGQMERLRLEFELFDIDDPIDQLDRLRKLLFEFTDLPEELEQQLKGANLDTAEGRRQFERALQQIFEQFPELVASGAFGELSPQQVQDLIREMEGLTDQIGREEGEGAAAESFQIFRGVTELTARNIMGVLTTQDFRLAQIVENTARMVELAGGEGVRDGGFLQPLGTGTTLQPPQEEELAEMEMLPGGGPRMEMNVGDVNVGGITVEGTGDPEDVMDEIMARIEDEIDAALGDALRRQLQAVGDPTTLRS